ncbi:DUF2752 domain-containing protein [Flavobacterium sp.]|uniref:DUF2752 domain-containing protein n=1 Tax=Flavobacterium sp. TaxID=239 RepID=UPI00120E723D|nr:DUF2752 domain-containing protein [Flavobacterium sp.]RZJ73276.1 MAG: DUF2752 domain-containing protein [Flavobacterium sp.]
MKKDKLYSLAGWACAAGYLYFVLFGFVLKESPFGVCLFKNATGIPCPSCGATRALKLLVHGEFWESLLMNPIGIILAVFMILIPIWILSDKIQNHQSFYNFYLKSEQRLRKPAVAITLVALVVANWVWGISKGL